MCPCGYCNFAWRTKCLRCTDSRKDPPVKGTGKGGGRKGDGKGKSKGKGKDSVSDEVRELRAQLDKANAEIAKQREQAADGAGGGEAEGDEMDVAEGDPDEALQVELRDRREIVKVSKRIYREAFTMEWPNAKFPDGIPTDDQAKNDFVGGPYRRHRRDQDKVEELETEYRESRPLELQQKATARKLQTFEGKLEKNRKLAEEHKAKLEQLAADSRKVQEEAGKLGEIIRGQEASAAELKQKLAELEAVRKDKEDKDSKTEAAAGSGDSDASADVNAALLERLIQERPEVRQLRDQMLAAHIAERTIGAAVAPAAVAAEPAAAGGACAAAELPGIATGDISTVGRTSGSGKVSGPAARALDGERAAAGPYGTHALRGC